MRPILARITSLSWPLLALLVLVGCGGSDDGPTGPSDPLEAGSVNEFVNDLPDWEVPDATEAPPTTLEEEEDFDGNSYVRCETVEYDRKSNFDNLIAVGANTTALKPGMLVQGRGVRDGALSTIGLARSPISISIDLALEDPSRDIAAPISTTIQDAVASLQREADTRLGNLDVIPAQISFQAKEAYSFEQAMLDAGISLKYSAVLASGSVGTSLRQSSQQQSRTVIVKLFQPMYTISFADDALAAPADFFADTVTQADFEEQVRLGTMGAGNQPCYVQSVSYGRMLVYTATSSEAQSANELKLALEASYGAYSGSANLTQRQKELVSNSSIEVQVFGGTQSDATSTIRDIIKNGDYSGFLRPVPATTAVPLSYRINDMKNRQAAVIGDATKYTIQTCETFNDLRFTISLDRIEIINGGDEEMTFDIEAGVSADSDWYWLLHNPGRRFERAELETIGETAIFEFNVNEESTLDFFVADFGNSTTGRDGWSGNKIFDFPFEFDTNPHTFTMFYTTTDDQFRNTSMEIYFTVERELINLP
jgi:hypothetical protein